MKVYGEFFHNLWNQSKTKLGWKGKIIYEKLSPPWLKGEVLFLYGPNNCSSIPCKHGELPRKGMSKDRNQNVVRNAILAYWLQKEEGPTDVVRWFLRKNGIAI